MSTKSRKCQQSKNEGSEVEIMVYDYFETPEEEEDTVSFMTIATIFILTIVLFPLALMKLLILKINQLRRYNRWQSM